MARSSASYLCQTILAVVALIATTACHCCLPVNLQDCDHLESDDGDIGLELSATEPLTNYTGLVAVRTNDGAMWKQGHLANGEREGCWIAFYKDGTRSSQAVYRHGQRDGKHRAWYPDGQLAESGRYSRGVRVGSWVEYHGNGQISIGSRYRSGRLHGEYCAYYRTGAPTSRGRYDYGNRVGLWREWTAVGVLTQTDYGPSP